MSAENPEQKTFKPPQDFIDTIKRVKENDTPKKVDLEAAQKEEIKSLDRKKEEELRTDKLKNDELQARVNKINDDNNGRKRLTEVILTIVTAWMLLILATVWAAGRNNLHLSDAVLITLIGTTTANIIALLVIVANYLFNKDKST